MKLSNQHYGQDLRKYYRMPVVQVSLTVVLSLFLIAIFLVFALRPTIVSIVNLQKTIAESRKVLKQLDTKVSYLQKASTELEAINPVLATLNTNIPNSGAQYSPLTKQIEQIALQTGAKLESESIGPTLLFSRILSPFTPNKKQNVIALPFTLKVAGKYPSIASFLDKLLTMERVLMVESITITRQTATKNSGSAVTLNVSGNAYYLADEAQLQKSMPEKKGKK